MNDNRIEGEWRQTKGWIKEQWGRLTDDDIAQVDGQLENLAGRVQERYGYSQEQAQQEVRQWNERRSRDR